jgi:hypothetical protein
VKRVIREIKYKRIKFNRKDTAAMRAQMRVREAWPKRAHEQHQHTEELLKAAKKKKRT